MLPAPVLYALAMARLLAPERSWGVTDWTVSDGRVCLIYSARKAGYLIDSGGVVPVQCPVDDLICWLPAAVARTAALA